MINNPRRFLGILLLVSAALFFLDRAQAFTAIFDLTQKVAVRPFVVAGEFVFEGSVSIFESFFLVRSFLDEHEEVLADRDFYRGEYLKLRSLQEENEFLRQALNFEEEPQQLVLAQVVSFDPLRPNQLVTINKGERDGIKIGQSVILAGRILIGRIQEASNNTSRILLITSEQSRIASTLEGSSTNVIVRGSASGALILELVPKEVEVQRGEIVATSGLGGDIPRYLLVGEVSKVVSEQTASFKEAVVRPFFNFNDLRQVFIVKTVR